jgi:hypothetical protein
MVLYEFSSKVYHWVYVLQVFFRLFFALGGF